jgi:hypothetical protein
MKRVRIGIIPIFLIIILVFASCEDESTVVPSLLTEDVIYNSGEKMRLLGRIITTQEVNASDHGFYLSETENFSQPIVISLGARQGPGRFIGEVSGLSIQKTYYVKAFIESNGQQIFGNVLTTSTLSPAVTSMTPNNGKAGIVISILGRNFTSDTQVFFGDRPGVVLGIDFESRLRVRVPESPGVRALPVKVVSQGRELILTQPFSYTTGTYAKIGNFPISERFYDNIWLQEGSSFYTGLGTLRGLAMNNSMWKYEVEAGQWRQIEFAGRPIWMSFFSGNYFGGGSSVLGRAPFVVANDFWRLNNGVFEKLPDLPFNVANAASFTLENELYVIGGIIGFSLETYRYNSSLGQWQRIANAPFPITKSTTTFTYKSKAYFINPQAREVQAFDAATQKWSFITRFPTNYGNGGGFGIVIGDKAYVGLEDRSSQIWELDLLTLNWAAKNEFTGVLQARNAGVFVHNGLIYILRSGEIQFSGPMEFYVFDPNGI